MKKTPLALGIVAVLLGWGSKAHAQEEQTVLVSAKKAKPIPSDFQEVEIPGARCGDGSPYKIFLRPGDPAKFLIHLEGGGVCWSKGTCFGLTKLTKLEIAPQLADGVYFGPAIENDPFSDFTYAYLPYCTGDIYSGRHTAVYGNKTVYHEGHLNVAKVLEVLVAQTSLAQARDVVFFGESAGALGVLLNLNQVDAVTPKAERRLALLDSPGLHFKDDVWQRFDATYLDGIRQGLLDNHMVFDTSSGILAPQLLNYCAGFPNWKIGVVQATKDIVMSVGFGNLTPDQHAARVNGPTGIVQQLANPNDNCVSWVPNKMRHVYSVDPKGWVDQTEDGVTDETFVNELYASRLEDPHLSHH